MEISQKAETPRKHNHSDHSVFGWAKRKVNFYWANLFAIVGVLSYVSAMVYYLLAVADKSYYDSSDFLDWVNGIKNLLIWTNLIISLLFIWISVTIYKSYIDESHRSVKFLEKYFFDLMSKNKEAFEKQPEKIRRVINRLNLLLACFWVYGVIHYGVMLIVERAGDFNLGQVDTLMNTIGALVVTNLFFALAIGMSNDDIEKISLRWKIPMIFSSLTFALFLVVLWNPNLFSDRLHLFKNKEEFYTFMKAISAIWTMIFLALFVSKLDNVLIGIPSEIMSIAYGYAIIQVMYPFLINHNLLANATFFFLVLFKVYFFIVYYYSVKTGRLYNLINSGSYFAHDLELDQTLKMSKWLKKQISSLKNYSLKYVSLIIIGTLILMFLIGTIYMFREENSHFLICLTTIALVLLGFLINKYPTKIFDPKIFLYKRYALENNPLLDRFRNKAIQPAIKEKVIYRIDTFQTALSQIWLSLLVYYVFQIIFNHNKFCHLKSHALVHAIEIILNSLVLVFVYKTYISLFIISAKKGKINTTLPEWKLIINSVLNKHRTLGWFLYAVFCISLLIITVLGIVSEDTILLGYLFTAADCLSGIACGIFFCLLFGKLSSRLIGIRSAFLFFLFLYAGIQPLFFAEHNSSETLFYSAVFISLLGKFVLLLLGTYIIYSGRLYRYFLLGAHIREKVFAFYQNPIRIEITCVDDLYRVLIIQNNKVKLISECINSTLEDVLEVIDAEQKKENLISESHRSANYANFKKLLNNGQMTISIKMSSNKTIIELHSPPFENDDESNLTLDILLRNLYQAQIVVSIH